MKERVFTDTPLVVISNPPAYPSLYPSFDYYSCYCSSTNSTYSIPRPGAS